MYIKGVNLGNWLVLEKWMSPALFAQTDAEDEYYLPRRLSEEAYRERIRIHRSEYITERDFAQIKSYGLNAVRIPIPYFVFGDCPPFIGCQEELDKAFAWAEKYGLVILLDLHTVPGSQNGFDNGGLSGVCKWATEPKDVEFALSVLERLAKRYGERKGLYGIQILNEPVTKRLWETMNIQKRYPPVDLAMAEGSGPISIAFLKDFYVKAYRRMRPYLPLDKAVVFHDGFELMAWKDFMRDEEFVNVILDTHQYLMMAEIEGCGQTAEAYAEYVRTQFAPQIEEMQQYFPVICGEWSLFNSYGCGMDTKGGQSPINGILSTEDLLQEEEKRKLYASLAAEQLKAWKKGSGYFYWNYKLLLDTVNETGWIGWDSWDFGKCVAQGWFPVDERKEM